MGLAGAHPLPLLDNPRHERFAQLLAKGKTQADAYEEAGYRPNDGGASRLAGNVKVKARLTELTERAATRAEVSKSWVMERLMRNAQMCLGEAPMVTPGDGDSENDDVVEYKRDPAAANQALQLLGKELGMFVDRSISATTTLEEMLDRIDGDDDPAGPRPAAGEPEAAAD